jgi:tetratricopeptide (TPR) repeat protein
MLPELDNFRATFEWLLEHDPVSAAEFSAVIHRFFDRLAMQDEELRWIDRVFEANRELPARIEGEVLDARMTLLINQGRPQGAVEAARRVLEIARASGSEAEIVSALIALSLPLTTESNKDEVAAIAREAVERANALGDELEISRANAALASTELLSPAERRRMLAESIATQRRLGRNRHAALTMMRLSLVELRDGEPEAAVRVAAPLVELCRSIEPTLLVRSLGMLSAALAKAGDVAGALSAAREQLERAAAIRKPFDCRSAVCVLVALQEEVRDPVLHAKLLGYVRGDLAAFQDAWWREVFAMREAAIKRVEAMIGRERFEEYALEGATWSEETVHRESLKL